MTRPQADENPKSVYSASFRPPSLARREENREDSSPKEVVGHRTISIAFVRQFFESGPTTTGRSGFLMVALLWPLGVDPRAILGAPSRLVSGPSGFLRDLGPHNKNISHGVASSDLRSRTTEKPPPHKRQASASASLLPVRRAAVTRFGHEHSLLPFYHGAAKEPAHPLPGTGHGPRKHIGFRLVPGLLLSRVGWRY